MHGEKEGEKREKTTTLSEKKEGASNVSEQRDKGWIQWQQWQQHGRATDAHELPHTKKEWEVSLNTETAPLTCTS